MSTPEGRPPILDRLPTHGRLGLHPLDGLPFYAGTLSLTRVIDWPAEGAGAELDRPIRLRLPEEVAPYLGVAELRVNGQPLGVRPWAPGLLRPAGNQVTLTLTTTLVGLLEGKWYDPARRAAVRIGA